MNFNKTMTIQGEILNMMRGLRKSWTPAITMAVLMLCCLSSCVKDEFDAPPSDGEDPDITATITISDLKNRFDGENPEEITDSSVIQGIVISNDRTGNFYKTLVIQDNTAGISIRIDQTDLYVDYPVGRRVFIKCKGLWLGDYEGLVQLGGLRDDSDPQNPGVLPIPAALVGNYILKGKYNIPVTPITLTIDQLDNLYQNMLIRLNNVEFMTAELGQTYADAVDQFSENRMLTDCNGNSVILRTSGFASFAGDTLPVGNGSLTAIFSVFRDDFQLIINDVADVHFDSTRCTAGPADLNGIYGIRVQYSGTNVTLGDDTIKGVVISSSSANNFDARNLVVQDSTGGIVVRFTAAHSFNTGDSVMIDISGRTLTDFNGVVQIDAVPNADASRIGTGSHPITPRVTTIAQILINFSAWESTLVQIANVTISGDGTYEGTTTLNDGTGTMNMFTRSSATFADDNYPTTPVTITGVVGNFNGDAQINIRTTADVQ